jgi:CDP-diglyceride synthetase
MLAALCLVALAGAAVTLGTLVVLHLAPTGLSPLRDPVSAYGISRYRLLYRAQTLGTAVAAAALAVALPLAGVQAAVGAVVALIVLAAARGVISWMPMDAPGSSRTPTGRGHNLLAFGAFAAASVGGFLVGVAFGSTPGLAAAAPAATALGWLMTAASALTIVSAATPGLRAVFGLAERLIYVGMLAWLVLTAIVLLGR